MDYDSPIINTDSPIGRALNNMLDTNPADHAGTVLSHKALEATEVFRKTLTPTQLTLYDAISDMHILECVNREIVAFIEGAMALDALRKIADDPETLLSALKSDDELAETHSDDISRLEQLAAALEKNFEVESRIIAKMTGAITENRKAPWGGLKT
jgi:hypothetical protein